MFDLTGKIAVVTGASSGLGADSARAYAEAGANVALLARRQDKLEALAEELRAKGIDALPVGCDVTDEASIEKAVKTVIEHFGRIDILLNNAGVAVRGGVETLSQEDWDRSMNINVKGMYMMSKYVIPHMKAQNYGKIVNISSVNALIGDKNDMFIRHAYNTSTAAVLGLTLGMACSYGQFNITVNAVCPGLFESEMTQNTLFKSEAFLQGYSAQCPMGRPGRHGEVSGPVLFFSSDASSYVTGQRIIVDGGTSLV